MRLTLWSWNVRIKDSECFGSCSCVNIENASVGFLLLLADTFHSSWSRHWIDCVVRIHLFLVFVSNLPNWGTVYRFGYCPNGSFSWPRICVGVVTNNFEYRSLYFTIAILIYCSSRTQFETHFVLPLCNAISILLITYSLCLDMTDNLLPKQNSRIFPLIFTKLLALLLN